MSTIKKNAIVDETAILEVIDTYRSYDKILSVILDDEGLYRDFCCVAEIESTDSTAELENALSKYLLETLTTFDSDEWWMNGCRECLVNHLRAA